jgi:putative hydrolase of the HAD superfamily
MNEIQAVLFDFGMVLSLPPDPAAWARMRAITGLSESDLYREYWAHRHAYDRGALTGETYWHKAAQGAGIPLDPAQLADLLVADVDLWTQLNLPMVEWAQRLQRAGIRTGILSNMPDAMEAGIVAKFDWLQDFDHNTWSHALKIAKPEAAIYAHAAEGLKTDPAHILFIDDRQDNVEAAIAAGMQAIQYRDHDSFVREMNQRSLGYLLDPTPTP